MLTNFQDLVDISRFINFQDLVDISRFISCSRKKCICMFFELVSATRDLYTFVIISTLKETIFFITEIKKRIQMIVCRFC
jgi:hypothetical protein